MKTPKDMIKGCSHKTNNCGEIVVIEYMGCNSVLVRFSETGSTCTSSSASIRIGSVRDYFKATAYGVGFVGDGIYTPTYKKENTPSYEAWRSMIRRCYSKDFQEKHPTYKGCSVSKEWHNYQNFAEWFNTFYFEGGTVDKDTVKKGNRIYSKENCVIITRTENTCAAHLKLWSILKPNGEIESVMGITDFCKRHNLSQSCMSRMLNGKLKAHKGFSLG